MAKGKNVCSKNFVYILYFYVAYVIMRIDKRNCCSYGTQNENPRVAARGFSCLIILDGKT